MTLLSHSILRSGCNVNGQTGTQQPAGFAAALAHPIKSA